jgi:hypothetical protein
VAVATKIILRPPLDLLTVAMHEARDFAGHTDIRKNEHAEVSTRKIPIHLTRRISK